MKKRLEKKVIYQGASNVIYVVIETFIPILNQESTWIKCFLWERLIIVAVDLHNYKSKSVYAGVPQGSALSPTFPQKGNSISMNLFFRILIIFRVTPISIPSTIVHNNEPTPNHPTKGQSQMCAQFFFPGHSSLILSKEDPFGLLTLQFPLPNFRP